MTTSSDKLKHILPQQQEQFEKFQLNLITALTQQFQIELAVQNSTNSTKNSTVDFLAKSISTVDYESSNNTIFSHWFQP